MIDTTVRFLAGSQPLTAIFGYVGKSTLLLLMVLTVLPLLRNRTPILRHLVLRSAIVGVLLLSLLSPLLPGWEVSLPPGVGDVLASSVSGIQTISGDQSANDSVAFDLVKWLVFLWLAGIVLMGMRSLMGALSVHRMSARSCFIDTGTMLTRARKMASGLGIRRQIKVVISSRVTIPIVWGLFRPVVILPRKVRQWPAPFLDMVLRHELAHIKRYDVLWINVAAIVTALHWFNPLVWLLAKRMQRESEYACDDHVLSAGVNGSDYANHLLESARRAGRLKQLFTAGVAPAHNIYLEGRIMEILNNRRRATSLRRWVSVSLSALTTLIVLPLAGITFEGCSSDGENHVTTMTTPKQVEAGRLPAPDDFVAVDTVPEMIHNEEPQYPVDAISAGIEGKVWVKALVNESGSVVDVRLGKSSGNSLLDEAAVRVAKKNTFKPAMQNGEPVAVWITYSVVFTLADKP